MSESRFTGRTFEVPCTVDIAQTPDTLHAHVTLDGVDIGPGDTVLVHEAPVAVGYGESLVCERRATVRTAGWFERLSTRFGSRFELATLYEVSFSPGRIGRAAPRRRTP
jgi:hypothetical protein